ILIFYNVLVGQSMSSINTCKWLTGAWVLAGSFLAYNYQGNNIDQLTSPLTPKKLETFNEIFSKNLTIFSMPLKSTMIEMQAKWFQNSGHREHFPLFEIGDLTISEMYMRNHWNESVSDVKERLRAFVRAPRSFEESLKMAGFEYYVQEISKCLRAAFIDRSIQISRMRFELAKIPDFIENIENVARSKLSYGKYYELWWSRRVYFPITYFEIRFLSMVQAGLVTFWKNWKFRVETWNDTVNLARLPESAKVKPLSTNDNIVVVFYLHLLLLIVCFVPFLYESRKYLTHKIAFVGSSTF
ncbi:unnamed protein product, partial [Orchesella dallaii]